MALLTPMLQASVLGETIVNPTAVNAMDAFNFLLKIFFAVGFLLYVIFAFIALRQIQIMKKTVITPFSSTLVVIGWVHLAVALVLFALVLLF